MADKGKKVSIKLPDGTIGDIPEENVQEALKRGAQLADTALPPARGLAGVPSAIARKAEDFEIGPYIEKVKSAIAPVAEFLSGAVSSAMQQPVGLARLAGVEPSTVKIPEPVSRAARGAMAFGLGPAFGLAETTTQVLKPPKQPGLSDLITGKDTTQTTVSEMVKAPESGSGRAGEFAMDVASFAVPYTAATKLPAVASFISKSPKMARFADLMASNTLSSMQEYAKTGDWDKALDSAGFGMLADIGLRSLGKTAKQVAPPIADLLARWSLPLKAKLGQKAKAVKEYHKELAARMIKTASEFTDKGLEAIENRFSSVVGAMKNASKEADDLLNELDTMGLVPQAQTKIVDFASEMSAAFNKLYTETKGLKEKKALKDAFDSLMGDMPTGKMSFAEAETEKERLNRTLSSLYDKGVMPVDLNIDKKIKLLLNDSIRSAQNKAFDELKGIKNQLYKSNQIPVGSPADLMNPWDITVPGEEGVKTYKEVQSLAMKDADILGAGWGANLKMTPQADYSYYNPMASSIALSQFANASLFTPSQVATGFRVVQSPTASTWIASRLAKASKKPPVTGIPPSVGRAVTRAVGTSSEEPTTESLPSSLAPRPELPKGTDYWGRPLSR